MPDQSDEDKKKLLGSGGARMAADKLSGRSAQIDAEVRKAMGEPEPETPKHEQKTGTDKGEFGKLWDKVFHNKTKEQ